MLRLALAMRHQALACFLPPIARLLREFTCPGCLQVCLDSGIIEGYY